MKQWHQMVLYMAVISLSCHFSISQASRMAHAEENKKLISENERLRSFNTRRTRRFHWMLKPEKIDAESVALANHILGTPPSVVAALLFCENGPQDLETGSIDKTDYFAMKFPITRWSTLDGSRTLNRLLWDWVLKQDEATQKSFFMHAAKPYTALSIPEQKQWARNMQAAEKRFRTEIKVNHEKPAINRVRTPTP